MSIIKLRDYQIEAVTKSLQNKNALLCMKAGSGKTLTAIFLSRYLLNKKKVDKIVIACTVSSVGPFSRELKKIGIEGKLIEEVTDFVEFLKSKEKFVLIKQSFIEELGKNQTKIDLIGDFLKKDYKNIMLVIDEAHKFSNTESWGSVGVDNTFKFWSKIILLTATPFSSNLRQIFGLIKLIYPKQWKNLKTFVEKYIKVDIIRNWKTGKFLRTEDIEYINLPELRNELSEFTFFYYPPIKLNYIEHKVKLNKDSYQVYKDMCLNIYAKLKERCIKSNDAK